MLIYSYYHLTDQLSVLQNKKMSNQRKILNGILVGLALLFIFTVWYTERYGMDKVAPFELNDTSLDSHILIATQGSAYKDRVVADVISSFYYDSIYIKIIDVHELGKETTTDWDAMVILHTWEIGEPPQPVTDFIVNVEDRRKLIVIATSGSGEEGIEGIDGISSASLMYEIPIHVQLIVDRIYDLTKTNRVKEISSI